MPIAMAGCLSSRLVAARPVVFWPARVASLALPPMRDHNGAERKKACNTELNYPPNSYMPHRGGGQAGNRTGAQPASKEAIKPCPRLLNRCMACACRKPPSPRRFPPSAMRLLLPPPLSPLILQPTLDNSRHSRHRGGVYIAADRRPLAYVIRIGRRTC